MMIWLLIAVEKILILFLERAIFIDGGISRHFCGI